MPDPRFSTDRTQDDEISAADWIRLGIIALIAMPVVGMVTGVAVFGATRSLQMHVATAALLPAAVVALVAPRFGASRPIVLRLALTAALLALVLLDIGWSGVPG